ncbi:Fatty acid hydroxylase [Macleaya cordata]|uniref:Fatty acid hydroxylase n=1 Tax=Macleaya cordata TaxID=56857 RepID=A0A200QIP7_MACCD|nr:Fatty acid hydroxylase [Macleaya cordata]
MASKPGILTEWPWAHLGRFKYVVYSFIPACGKEDEREWDMTYFLVLPILLWRMLHNQIWISLARSRTAKAKNRILDKSIDFEQVDRESNWDDQIILNGVLFYLGYKRLPGTVNLPIWRTDGVVLTALLHTGPVEFLYYWLHRALHHHFLYSRYHSHHHSSIVTEPITSVIHPFGEHILYFLLFAIPIITMLFTGTASMVAVVGYLTYIDFMNNMGHCNFELVPRSIFTFFPFLKYLFYTPSYHSLHHTQFRTNYALFMPMYDYIYGTMDKSSDLVYETSLSRQDESPHVVHLTHPTTPDSIYHLRLGFASLASGPYTSSSTKKWYMWLLWPVTCLWTILFNWIFSTTFIVERNVMDGDKLKMQTWAVPKFSYQYNIPSQRGAINGLVEEAILEADNAGVKVLSLGLLNQAKELNRNGEVYIWKHPKLKIKLVDGSSLATALVLNSIPEGTNQVLIRGKLTKVAYAITLALCQRGVQVVTVHRDEFEKLKLRFGSKLGSNLILSRSYDHHQKQQQQVWLVGDEFSEKEQKNAPAGTLFIPFTQFPPMMMMMTNKMRKDCVYYNTPAMVIPSVLENMHSCENWLPRRVMSAWRVAGIVHALEEWETHECGDSIMSLEHIEKVWVASLQHGFRPLAIST